MQRITGSIATHRVDAHVGTERIRLLLQEDDRIVHFREVIDLCRAERAGELEPVVDVIDDDDPSRPEQPGRPRRRETNGAGANITTVSPGWIPPISAA